MLTFNSNYVSAFLDIIFDVRRNTRQYQCSLDIAEKYIEWATVLSLTIWVYLHSQNLRWARPPYWEK